MQIRHKNCCNIHRRSSIASSRCRLSMTEEQQTAKYINGLSYTIQERVALHDVFSVDKVHYKAMKIERLQSKTPLFSHQLSIEEPVEGDEVQPSSTTTDQPLIQLTTKASTLTPTTTPAVAKSEANSYSRHRIGKCYRCDEPGQKSNECPKRR